MRTRFETSLGWIALLAAVAGPLVAQQSSGRLRGDATDDSGEPLPGVTISLTRTATGDHEFRVTDDDGRFLYSTLVQGSYELQAALDGFRTTVIPNIVIQLATESAYKITLELGRIAEELIVSSEKSLLAVIGDFFGKIFDRLDLDQVPGARDLWAVATGAPGVIADRVNVGGSESGEQPAILAAGSAAGDNTYLVDGVVATDAVDAGASLLPDHGFESIEEVQVATGGSAAANAAAGAVVNLVTRAGTNRWRSSSRYGRIDSSLQFGSAAGGGPVRAASAASRGPGNAALGQSSHEEAAAVGNRTAGVERFSLELGGPIQKDRTFIWAGYGRSEVDRGAFGGGLELTESVGWNVKANRRMSDSISAAVAYTARDRTAQGRGAAPDRAPETTWDEDVASRLWKAELTSAVGNDLSITARYGAVRNATRRLPFAAGGVAVDPDGVVIQIAAARDIAADPGAAEASRDAAGVWRHGFLAGSSLRESGHAQAEGTYVLSDTAHALSFGASYRRADTVSAESWPGRGVVNVQGENFGLPVAEEDVAVVTRDGAVDAVSEYGALWLQDAIRLDRWSFNAGLRLDLQEGGNGASMTPASRFLPDVLPALDFAGNDGGFTWETFSPRLEAIRAFGSGHRTRLRFGYGRFAEQLGQAHVTRLNAAAPSRAYFSFVDANNSGVVELGELVQLFRCDNCSLLDPASPTTPDRTDPDLSPTLTDELLVGVEHQLAPRWGIGLAASYRRISDLAEERRLVVDEAGLARVATRADYLPDGTVSAVLPDGAAYRAPYFALRPGLRFTGGSLLSNGDREQDYLGVTLRLDKRHASASPLGFHVQISWSDWTWSVPAGFDAFDDPTDEQDPGDNDGAIVAQPAVRSAGGEALWLNSRWSFDLSGFYRIERWDVDLGFLLSGREGYPSPPRHRVIGSDGIDRDVAITDPGRPRLDDVVTVDLRLDKRLHFLSRFTANLSVEVFNATDQQTVLRREHNQTITRANFATETVNPRLVRLGVRLGF